LLQKIGFFIFFVTKKGTIITGAWAKKWKEERALFLPAINQRGVTRHGWTFCIFGTYDAQFVAVSLASQS